MTGRHDRDQRGDQSLQAMLAHVPGLKVVIPSTPYDARGLLPGEWPFEAGPGFVTALLVAAVPLYVALLDQSIDGLVDAVAGAARVPGSGIS